MSVQHFKLNKKNKPVKCSLEEYEKEQHILYQNKIGKTNIILIFGGVGFKSEMFEIRVQNYEIEKFYFFKTYKKAVRKHTKIIVDIYNGRYTL